MKVYIGPYKNWVGPYQIADALCFWAKNIEDEYGYKRKPDWVHNFGTWLSHGTTDEKITDSKKIIMTHFHSKYFTSSVLINIYL